MCKHQQNKFKILLQTKFVNNMLSFNSNVRQFSQNLMCKDPGEQAVAVYAPMSAFVAGSTCSITSSYFGSLAMASRTWFPNGGCRFNI